MIAEVGQFALALALGLALVQAVLPLWGANRGDGRLMAVAAPAAQGHFVLVAAAFLALTQAYVVSDFSVSNVYENSHTDKPLLYKVTGVWGNHEGSMLLWALMLALYGLLVAGLGRALATPLKARALAIQGLISAAFLAFLLFAANPFERLVPMPGQGSDLNPILQDPGLAFHPPLLYLGYVGFSIVFAFALAGLIEGRIDETWARAARPWALMAWSALTLGIALGSWWAYYELGWGGFWFWDPVENASLMPWLAGTALLHSITVLEKRGALKSWTVLLAILTFSLSLLGTFLVRSGVIVSVHAFASDPTRGLFILAIMAAAVGGSLALFAWRAGRLAGGRGFAPASREGLLLANNVLLAALTATVFLGTLYPLMLEAATGERISVGPPFYHRTFTPMAALLLLLVPLGASALWKRDRPGAILARALPAAGLALLVSALVLLIERPAQLLGVLGVALGLWLVAGSLVDLVRRRRAGQRPTLPIYGMLIAHAGLGVVAAGVSGVMGWQLEVLKAMAPGDRVALGQYTLVLERVDAVEGPNYDAERGTVRVMKDRREVARLFPERRFYPSQRVSTTEAAIRTDLLGDLYVVLGEPQALPGEAGPARYALRAYLNPLAPWIWLGAGLAAVGGLVSLWGRRRAIVARPRPLPAGAAMLASGA